MTPIIKAVIGSIGKRRNVDLTLLPFMVLALESNGDGYADNGLANTGEIGSRTSVTILNNTTLSTFDTLHISNNTHIGHTGAEAWGAVHGFQLQLANMADAGLFINSPISLVSIAQGGSTISQWDDNDAYYLSAVERLDAAVALKPAIGDQPKFGMFWTHGINDAIASTTTTAWKAATHDLMDRIDARYGLVPKVMTLIPNIYSSYNTAIQELCAERLATYCISTPPPTKDANHWQYAEWKFSIVPDTISKFAENGYTL